MKRHHNWGANVNQSFSNNITKKYRHSEVNHHNIHATSNLFVNNQARGTEFISKNYVPSPQYTPYSNVVDPMFNSYNNRYNWNQQEISNSYETFNQTSYNNDNRKNDNLRQFNKNDEDYIRKSPPKTNRVRISPSERKRYLTNVRTSSTTPDKKKITANNSAKDDYDNIASSITINRPSSFLTFDEINLPDPVAMLDFNSHSNFANGGGIKNKQMKMIIMNDWAVKNLMFTQMQLFDDFKSIVKRTCQKLKSDNYCLVHFDKIVGLNDIQKNDRSQFLNNVKNLLENIVPGVRLYPYGSFANGLSLCNSDVDVCVGVESDLNNINSTNCLNRHLLRSTIPRRINLQSDGTIGNCDLKKFSTMDFLCFIAAIINNFGRNLFSKLAMVPARIPLVQAITPNNVFIDFSVSNIIPVYSAKFIKTVTESNPKIKILVLFVKFWWKCATKNERSSLKSQPLYILILYYLYHYNHIDCFENMLKNNDIDTYFVDGVNIRLPKSIKVIGIESKPFVDILKDFFLFWSDHDFTKIVSFFKGKIYDVCTFNKENFSVGFRAKLFNVQDIFCLNRNTSEQVTILDKQMFQSCLSYSAKLFQQLKGKPENELLSIFFNHVYLWRDR